VARRDSCLHARAVDTVLTVLRCFSTVGDILNAKQRNTMQKKRTQAAVFYPSGETVSTDLRVPSPAGLVDFCDRAREPASE